MASILEIPLLMELHLKKMTTPLLLERIVENLHNIQKQVERINRNLPWTGRYGYITRTIIATSRLIKPDDCNNEIGLLKKIANEQQAVLIYLDSMKTNKEFANAEVTNEGYFPEIIQNYAVESVKRLRKIK